jgi:fructose-1,6-bisphosphatase I
MIVYTTGYGVMATLNLAVGYFTCHILICSFSKISGIFIQLAGNVHFPQGVKDYIKYLIRREGWAPFHYMSLVSDIHRNMIN